MQQAVLLPEEHLLAWTHLLTLGHENVSIGIVIVIVDGETIKQITDTISVGHLWSKGRRMRLRNRTGKNDAEKTDSK